MCVSPPPSQIPCLCGSAPCLLCRCCPSKNNSTVTRLIYAFFLLLGVGVSCIMLMPGMEGHLKKVYKHTHVYCVLCVAHCYSIWGRKRTFLLIKVRFTFARWYFSQCFSSPNLLCPEEFRIIDVIILDD